MMILMMATGYLLLVYVLLILARRSIRQASESSNQQIHSGDC